MKAKTRSQRRGRIRKQVAREPNGRPQRATVAEIRASTVHARMAQHKLTLVQAGDRLAGYEIGRLYLRGQIDLVDVEVCDDYVQTVARFMALTNPQHPFPKAMDYLAAKGFGGEPSQDQIASIRKRYAEWIEPLSGLDSRARMIFNGVVFYDNQASDIHAIKPCIAALRRKFR
jgi:hypothetical protein